MDFGHRRRTRGRHGARWLVVAGIALAGLIVAVTFLRGITVTERPNEMKTTRVILPPPPPPPPPPEVKPEEKPPEPKPMPVEQPVDSPPPPTPQAEPAPGNDALTAREGAGPSNYGLAAGDGSGSRIGGKAGGGGDPFGAYANLAMSDIRRAAQTDPALKGRFTVRLAVAVSPEGQIVSVRLLSGTGDTKRDAAIERRLSGLQLSQRPPAGLPVMRIELNARS
ncbi:MAG: TonB-dependent receptor [Pseudomonadota bacterium]